MRKKGVSKIISTVLLILIAIIAIVILAQIIRMVIEGAGGMHVGKITEELEIKKAYRDEENDKLYVIVERGVSDNELVAIKFIFSDEEQDKIVEKKTNLKSLETKYFEFDISGWGFTPTTVDIVPMIEVEENGKIKIVAGMRQGEKTIGVGVGAPPGMENGEVPDFVLNCESTIATGNLKQIVENCGVNEEGLIFYAPLDSDANDYSGNENHGTLIGEAFLTDGRYGGGLEVDGDGDYVQTASSDDFAVTDFTASAWVKYTTQDRKECAVGIQGKFMLGKSNIGSGQWYFRIWGPGGDYNQVYSTSYLTADEWHLLTGIRKDDKFYLYVDGTYQGEEEISEGAFSESLSIIGSQTINEGYWEGMVDEAIIWNRALDENEIEALYGGGAGGGVSANSDSRNIYRRDEGIQTILINIANLKTVQRNPDILISVDGSLKTSFENQQFDAFETKQYGYEIDPSLLKSGDYDISIDVTSDGDDETVYLPLYIRKVPNPQALPYLSWQGIGVDYLDELSKHGFTINKIGSDLLNNDLLDEFLKYDIDGGKYHSRTAAPYLETLSEEERLDAYTIFNIDGDKVHEWVDGDGITHYTSFINPFYEDYLEKASNSVVQGIAPYAEHVGFSYLLLNSELKDEPICFNDECRDSARASGALGADENMPGGFTNTLTKYGWSSYLDINYPGVPLPVNGVISNSNIYYRVWKWWKSEGSWHPIHCAIRDKLDVLEEVIGSPIELTVEFGQKCADYLESWILTAGNKKTPVFYNGIFNDMIYSQKRYGHKISTTFQFSSSVGEPIEGWDAWVEFVREVDPNGLGKSTNTYDEIKKSWRPPLHPDPFRESSWILFSKRPDRMGHWGAEACFTKNIWYPDECEATLSELKSLKENLFEPYYPMLKQLNRAENKVAFLKSEATWVYSGNYPYRLYGFHDNGAAYTAIINREIAMSLAGVQWDVVKDDNIFNGELSDYEYLIIMKTDVLPQTVYDNIIAFANSGGKVLADNLFYESFDTSPGNDVNNFYLIDVGDFGFTKTEFQTNAGKIRTAMSNAGLEFYASSSSTETVVNMLEKSKVKYVFVINDKKTYNGYSDWDYGVAQDIVLTLNEPGEVIIYDVVNREKLSYTRIDGNHVGLDLNLPASGGRWLAVYPKEINSVEISVPSSVVLGDNLDVNVKVKTASGLAPGSQPIKVIISSSDGVELDESDYYGTDDGEYDINIKVPVNIEKGSYTIMVEELMTGIIESENIEIK